jgi:hypothetical protein
MKITNQLPLIDTIVKELEEFKKNLINKLC